MVKNPGHVPIFILESENWNLIFKENITKLGRKLSSLPISQLVASMSSESDSSEEEFHSDSGWVLGFVRKNLCWRNQNGIFLYTN